ncbi:hypothetical protein CEXT_552311 [Caerostris extrusa]|uniref:Uncharacterized protein n=1 Tax=Caerostris extrusa TaxID=172846 RepID=A0AAV4U848_CAEEX|nr:hypothetical protein CEXT_552311 [Caerostris extrusa]
MADKQIVKHRAGDLTPTLWRHTPKPAPEGEINRGRECPEGKKKIEPLKAKGSGGTVGLSDQHASCQPLTFHGLSAHYKCRRHDGVALVAKRRHMGAGCGSMGLGHWEIFEIEALRSMDCLLFLRS